MYTHTNNNSARYNENLPSNTQNVVLDVIIPIDLSHVETEFFPI